MTADRNPVEQITEMLGGTIEEMTILPDGHGFAVVSFPLPADHWSTAGPDAYNFPPMPLRCGVANPQHEWLEGAIRAAARYAYRASTQNGRMLDLDPDALVQNMIVGLIGYYTADGLSDESLQNPAVIPPEITIIPAANIQ